MPVCLTTSPLSTRPDAVGDVPALLALLRTGHGQTAPRSGGTSCGGGGFYTIITQYHTRWYSIAVGNSLICACPPSCDMRAGGQGAALVVPGGRPQEGAHDRVLTRSCDSTRCIYTERFKLRWPLASGHHRPGIERVAGTSMCPHSISRCCLLTLSLLVCVCGVSAHSGHRLIHRRVPVPRVGAGGRRDEEGPRAHLPPPFPGTACVRQAKNHQSRL